MAIPVVIIDREMEIPGRGHVLILDMEKNVGIELALGMVIVDLFHVHLIVGIERRPHSTMVAVVVQFSSMIGENNG